jgi:lipopolysaccharide transport protein LptA
VFSQPDKNGKTTPLYVSARRLAYSGYDRKASFQGEVVAQGADATLRAKQMDVYLQSKAQTQVGDANGAAAPSQVERVIAQGGVAVEQGERRASGDVLTYLVDSGVFTLTGGPPSIFDAEHGQTTGDSLTFYSHDDRVQVESKGKRPTVTRTRVTK